MSTTGDKSFHRSLGFEKIKQKNQLNFNQSNHARPEGYGIVLNLIVGERGVIVNLVVLTDNSYKRL